MGKDAKAKTPEHRQEVLHRRQLFGGHETAEDIFRKGLAPHRCGDCQHGPLINVPQFNQRTSGCGGPAAVHFRLFWPMNELMHRWPTFVAKIAATNPDNPGQFPTVRFKQSAGDLIGQDFGLVTQYWACTQCQASIEKMIAKSSPSWVCVERDVGPGPDRGLVQVTEKGARAAANHNGREIIKEATTGEQLIKPAKTFPRGPSA